MGKNDFLIRRICTDGMLAGLYVVLTMVSINVTPMIRITFGSLPVVFSALLFGPVDALLIALVGEFLCQTLTYGFTLTTAVWVLVPAIRAVVIGLVSNAYKRKGDTLEHHKVLYFTVLIVASLLVTAANTGASVLDAYVYHYTFKVVWVTTLIRAAINVATTFAIGFLCLPLIKAVGSIVYPGKKRETVAEEEKKKK